MDNCFEPICGLITYTQGMVVREASALEVAAFLAVLAVGVWLAVKMYREH